ncbi:thioesterase II family protein [Streptomyces sp. SP17BM10]|uniref:thioesterase II family protein n=1 Tax=Streptomyces sp. SP17BM10 TaxID=3002530 RepID=UPI002E76FA46|nr:alpha/beta fold hydrolase [Streptomyces sp. SP17BM10]
MNGARSSVPLSLFCFHQAGGGISAFAGWQRRIPAGVRVVPVPLPGRDGECPTDLGELVAAVNDGVVGEALRVRRGEPFAFYGHSMGALVAYHLARLRASLGQCPPQRLIVGAYPAPHLPHRLSHAPDLSDDALLELWQRLDGAAWRGAGDPGWASRTLAAFRSHLRIMGTGSPVGLPGAGDRTGRLPCPIEVFTGVDDPLVTAAEARAWRLHTSAGSRVHEIPGGHFFPRESKEAFFGRLSAVLARALERHARPA